MNYTIAVIVLMLMCVYVAVEMGWGGSFGSWQDFRKTKDILWIRWRRIGLYPPEPKDDDPKDQVKPVSPKTPETVD